MTPLVEFNDGPSVVIEKPFETHAEGDIMGDDTEVIEIMGAVTPEELEKIKNDLRDGKTGLKRAVADEYGNISHRSDMKELNFRPELKIEVRAEKIMAKKE